MNPPVIEWRGMDDLPCHMDNILFIAHGQIYSPATFLCEQEYPDGKRIEAAFVCDDSFYYAPDVVLWAPMPEIP